MEEIINQKFTYATITVFKDYCKIIDKKESLSSMGVDLDSLDDGDDEIFESAKSLIKFTIGDMRRPTFGRTTEFPEKVGKRKTKFFYGEPGINERSIINYAIRNFETRDDRHIKKYYGSPFSEMTVTTIERSIRRHGDKITIKLYRHHRHRAFNNIYFKKSTGVESVTFNVNNGNFTTLSMNKSGRKTTKTFRTNNFNFLEMQFKDGGILNMRKCLDDNSVLLKEYNETFNNTDFIFEINKVFNLNQNFSFNGIWFCQLMLERFVELKKIKVSNDYGIWIKKYYPTEKFLKKNDRKLIASILDMFQIKSKITIKIMHENTKIDIHALSRLCYFFGDNFSKYIGSIDLVHFMNSTYEDTVDIGYPKFKFAEELKKEKFLITNIEKENIVKIINNLNNEIRGYQRLTNKKETLINHRFIGDLNDHFKMIDKLRKFIPDLYLKSKNIDDFDKEHLELSKMMKFIKKGYVIEYQFVDKMVNDVESPIKVKINLSDDESNPEWVNPEFYPYILKREEDYDEEGNFMHHCVASYSDKEKSIVVSVRTEDKKDRVTCEFDCQTGTLIQARHFCNKQPPADIELAVNILKEKTKHYARMGLLHSLDKKKVPVKINGIEIIPEIKEPTRISDVLFDMRREPAF
jgi:hypothetical protein